MNLINPHVLEGDFIETHDGLIFDAKGIYHPDQDERKIAYLRYIPVRFFNPEYEFLEKSKKVWLKNQIEKDFDVLLDDIRYREVPYAKVYEILSRFTLLHRFKPSYIFDSEMFDFPIQTVPLLDIKKIHHPDEFLKKALLSPNSDPILIKLIEFISTGSNIPNSHIGLSGSKMVELEGRISDYDLIIYGEKESRKVHEFLEDCLFYPDGLFSDLRHSFKVKLYNEEFLQKHYSFRAKGSDISFQQFRRTESKKSHQFLIEDREVYLRYLKDTRTHRDSDSHMYSYKSIGRVSLKGKIIDEADSIFTPGRYTIRIAEVHQGEHLKPNRIIDIFTMRGRFLENAHLGDIVEVRGKLEKIIGREKPTYQIVLGVDPEDILVQI